MNERILIVDDTPANIQTVAAMMWAARTSPPERRLELARRASTEYARAVALSPRSPDLWHEWAALELSLLQRPEEGRQKALRALDLNPRHESALALLGNYEPGRWRERPATEEGRQALRRSAAYYERASAPPEVRACLETFRTQLR